MSSLTFPKYLPHAIRAFGMEADTCTLEPLKNGLINFTLKVSSAKKTILLQQINKYVFTTPADLIHNHLTLYSYLKERSTFRIPAPLKTRDQNNCFTDPAMQCWRAMEFMLDSHVIEKVQNVHIVWEVARCFGNFTHSLSGLDLAKLRTIIPQFHSLTHRYNQFLAALKTSVAERVKMAEIEIEELLQRNQLVAFYSTLCQHSYFKLRVMHHDAKLSNVLFEKQSGKLICPVDLDTTQAGYFFSDLGDMIRSMACSENEHSTAFLSLQILPDYYEAILEGYLDAIGPNLTEVERKHIHAAGLLMIYMQALRYMTDFLQGEFYFRTDYTGQNLDRARNQLALLKSLENFLLKTKNYSV